MIRDAFVPNLFGLTGRTAIVTGGTGTLGSEMARGLARADARVGVLGRRRERADEIVHAIEQEGGEALALIADVLDRATLERARQQVQERWGELHILVNAAGGNNARAMTGPDRSFFDLASTALEDIIDLNLMGTVLPCQVFGSAMAASGGSACIVNISSLAADRALTRVVGYAAGKAAVENFTRWLAVEMARAHGAAFRVNALAPGFFVAEQNRSLLFAADGTPSERTQAIIAGTPAGRFGSPAELVGPLIWLCSPAAGFVTGAVIVVDGGFSAFSGV